MIASSKNVYSNCHIHISWQSLYYVPQVSSWCGDGIRLTLHNLHPQRVFSFLQGKVSVNFSRLCRMNWRALGKTSLPRDSGVIQSKWREMKHTLKAANNLSSPLFFSIICLLISTALHSMADMGIVSTDEEKPELCHPPPLQLIFQRLDAIKGKWWCTHSDLHSVYTCINLWTCMHIYI